MIYEARLLKGPDLADAENPQRFLKHWLNVLKKKKKKSTNRTFQKHKKLPWFHQTTNTHNQFIKLE